MSNNFLGTIGILIMSLIIYIISSGASELSLKEKIISAGWAIILLVLCAKLL